MIKASLDTPNFSFEAYGSTTGHAVKALERGLDLHGEQYKLAADWWHAMRSDIATIYFAPSQCYRDGERLK
jgi:hypothetical protein